MPPRILILSLPDDVHAHCVLWVLRSHGVECTIWYQSQFPFPDRLSLGIADRGESWTSIDAAYESPITAVWSRRFGVLDVGDDLHPGDAAVSQEECGRFLNCLRFLVAPEALWINPYDREFYANSKAVQLAQAVRSGLMVPDTLMSNDSEAVKAFMKRHDRIIYKPFYPAQWQIAGGVASTFTTILDPTLLDDPESLQRCPGIFQPLVRRKYEARVTICGEVALAARIDIGVRLSEVNDWRQASLSANGVSIEPLKVPDQILRGCLCLMKRLGIVFGCFDFIIDVEGHWVFLEVNPMGQFLWVEEACPEIPLLATFCDFLLAGRADFRGVQPSSLCGVHCTEILESTAFSQWLEEIRIAHRPPVHQKGVSE